MYKKTPKIKKIKKKLIYAFTKIFLRKTDEVLNTTFEEKVKRKYLKGRTRFSEKNSLTFCKLTVEVCQRHLEGLLKDT